MSRANRQPSRLEERAAAWRVCVEDLVDTPTSIIGFGQRDHHHVVLKVIKPSGNEWLSGQIVNAFAGRGVVRALEHAPGAVLLERLLPGTPLASETIPDEEATAIIAGVIDRMSPEPPPAGSPTVEQWAESFERYRAAGTGAIPGPLVQVAHDMYTELCASQAATRLLHGDLHHHNILLDSQRGWLAIDPKGVIGEPAFEVGAALRNPCERPELFTAPAAILKRVDCFARVLRLDRGRILGWAFAQAILAALWELEDDGRLSSGIGWIALANAIHPMLQS